MSRNDIQLEKIRKRIPALLRWFETEKRRMPWRSRRTPYRVWIAEIMLQQTRVDQATPYYRAFMKKFPSLKKLAVAQQDDVLKAWEGLGYYSRARNLHKAAQLIANEHGGRFPCALDEIKALPGIGDYTAAAIGSIAFNIDAAVVDGNVIRVLSRLFAYEQDAGSAAAKKLFQHQADTLLPAGHAAEYNEAMMELGAMICTPKNPSCGKCPLCPSCKGHDLGLPEKYPVKKKKKAVPHLIVGAAVTMNRKNEILIAQRREKDMLGGLWEFPGGKLEDGETLEECVRRELKEELGIHIETGEKLTVVRHAYSHFTIELHTYFAKIRSGRPRPVECAACAWVPLDRMHEYAFSKADLKIIDTLKKAAE